MTSLKGVLYCRYMCRDRIVIRCFVVKNKFIQVKFEFVFSGLSASVRCVIIANYAVNKYLIAAFRYPGAELSGR